MQLLIRRLGRSFGTLASGGLVGRRSWETGATKGHLMVKGETYHIVSELSPPRTRLAMRSFSRLSPLNSNGNSNGHSGPRGQADSRQASDEGQIRWYWIPASLGIAVIATQHFYHTYKDEVKRAQQQQGTGSDVAGGRVVVTGPWQVHVLSALPLKAMSRLFGWFNELTIPVPLRRPLLGFYAWLFGCRLDELKDPDLRNYPNLAAFFYRELKEGARPIYSDEHDENEGLLSSPTLTSPSDGRILHFGVIEQRQVEQVKGLTYDLDSFFGLESHRLDTDTDGRDIGNEEGLSRQTIEIAGASHSDYAVGDHEFANVNGITYSIDSLLNGDPSMTQPHSDNETEDSGNNSRPVTAVSALKDLGTRLGPNHRLFFCVIYLAPGDYHRFHSPANWVVEGRRHFAGELYSVSPYIASILPNLFVLNERVALLGRWRYGFMSMVPVGATNVGSIYINFDKDLKTNVKQARKLQHGRFFEISYKTHSKILGGVPLEKGQEIGGFKLGSTIVLIFEAPENFQFFIKTNQYIRMGELLGKVQY